MFSIFGSGPPNFRDLADGGSWFEPNFENISRPTRMILNWSVVSFVDLPPPTVGPSGNSWRREVDGARPDRWQRLRGRSNCEGEHDSATATRHRNWGFGVRHSTFNVCFQHSTCSTFNVHQFTGHLMALIPARLPNSLS